MKIVSFYAENFKRLRVVEITTDGKTLIEITGRNGQGKSSILDAIWAALAGAKHIQAVPIRKGATSARIRLDLGELIVERRFTEKGSTLIVEKADGSRYTSPQSILDALIGALSFDPLAFVRQDPRKQFETLRAIVPLEVNVEQLDGLNARDFERRTEINRDAKSRRTQADGITVPAGLPEAKVDVEALLNQIASAAKVNADIETRKGRRAEARTKAENHREKASGLRTDAEDLRRQAEEKESAALVEDGLADELEEKLRNAEPLPEPVDIDAIRAELKLAEATNRGIDQRARKAELLAQAAVKEKEAAELTATMEARTQAKADAIAKAPMPVPGLSFGDGVVMYDGLPFDQAETSAKLRVGVAIAMKMNPKLRVLRIEEGSFLDADNIAMIREMAREDDWQVWMERVETSGKVGIVIDDGQIAAVNASAEA